jgi:hypothetical protein
MNGHLPIRDHVVDDVALARCMMSQGYESRFLDVSPVLSVRLFRGFRGFAAAVARSAIPFLGSRPFTALMLSLIGVMLSFALLLMPVALILSFTLWSPGNAFSGVGVAGLVLSGYVASILPFVLSGWLHCRSRWWGLASPLGLSIMTTAVAIAALRCMCGFTVRWRGRSYPHAGRNNA